MPENIILIGSTGYVGSQVKANLTQGYNVMTRSWRDPQQAYNELCRDLDCAPIKAVVNCAGYVGKPNVDACEHNRIACYTANVDFALAIALACQEHDVSLGHVSSGCIYDGGPHDETSPANFIKSWYSFTKASAETVLNHLNYKKMWLWRLRMPFDNDFKTFPPRNLLAKLINYRTVINGTNSITYMPDFIQAVRDFIDKQLPYGTWNLVNPEPITNARIIELLDYERVVIDQNSAMAKSLMLAPRSFCTLDTKKAQSQGLSFLSTEAAVLRAGLCLKQK